MTNENHLAGSSSPYLLQHVHNPVDWYPWSEEALTKAARENKPILLSIGYSACHWCHVMAHESFEDPSTADIMNRFFINIKVDREERPDLDKIYQFSQQLLTGQGGWPLTVFLTPNDHMPFYSGTYFPKQPRYGIPAFKDVLLRIADFFANNQAQINSQTTQLRIALAQINNIPATEHMQLTEQPLNTGRQELASDFDERYGGFGTAPKFPQPTLLQYLLQYCEQHPHDTQALSMLTQTLDNMAQGGIFDQLGGGFFRYSVDQQWRIPHFEKMLYDNAQLLEIYCDAFRLTNNTFYATVAKEIAEWVINDMQAKTTAGELQGYYSTLDADSEGIEGKYYYWDREQLRSILSNDEYQVMSQYFGLTHPANFEHHWHLFCDTSIVSIAQSLKITEDQVQLLLQSGKNKLLQIRKQRILPHRDEKILTAWNALMIKAMVKAGYYLERPEFTASGLAALSFIHDYAWEKQHLFASIKDNEANFAAYLDDYAFLLATLICVLQFHWRSEYLNWAIALADILLAQFYDEMHGGFFFTAHEHEDLILRIKPLVDEAIPAGNGIATMALLALGYLLGESRYLNAAESSLKSAWPVIEKYPSAHASLLLALRSYLSPPETIILRGDTDSLVPWQTLGLADYHPDRLLFAIENSQRDLPGLLASYSAQPNGHAVTAYICQGSQCLPPVTNFIEFQEKIAAAHNLQKN